MASFLIAVSVNFPLFLIARESSMGKSDYRVRAADTVLLVVLAASMLGLTIWIVAV